MHTVYVIDEKDYRQWLQALSYSEYDDPKGWEGVAYLRCRDSCISFNAPIRKVFVPDSMQLYEVIGQAVGEPPRHYTDQEVHDLIQPRLEWIGRVASHVRHRDHEHDGVKAILDAVRQRVAATPSAQVAKCHFGTLEECDNQKTILGSQIIDGEALVLVRHALDDIIEKTVRSFIPPPSLCVMSMRNCKDLFTLIRTVTEEGELVSPNKRPRDRSGTLPIVVLLYTDEDPHVASYVRTHMDAIDKASGNICDIAIIERPSVLDSTSYWRKILPEVHYAAWRLLGWSDSLPYNKNESYTIAAKLGVPVDQLPCAVALTNKGEVEFILPLRDDLTSCLRRIIARRQGTTQFPSTIS